MIKSHKEEVQRKRTVKLSICGGTHECIRHLHCDVVQVLQNGYAVLPFNPCQTGSAARDRNRLQYYGRVGVSDRPRDGNFAVLGKVIDLGILIPMSHKSQAFKGLQAGIGYHQCFVFSQV